jgi:general stress protein 26
MLTQITVPDATPARKLKGYKMPETGENLVPWEFVTEQMTRSRHYWISTVFPDGRPHVVPVWGIWHANRFHFEGSMQTAWGQNIRKNPRTAVHLPSADQVVIIEGTAHMIQDDEIDNEMWNLLDSTFQRKYQVDRGSPYLYVQPRRVLAWNGEDLSTMTRWVFKN